MQGGIIRLNDPMRNRLGYMYLEKKEVIVWQLIVLY